jgi:hypothetical protein
LQVRLVRRVGFFNEGTESRRIVDSDVGQHLAIQIDARALEAIDELAVRDFGRAAGCIDAHDPQRTEIPLLKPAPDVPIPQRLFDGLLCGAVQLRLGEKITLRAAKCFVAIVSPIGPSFDSWHVFSLGELEPLLGSLREAAGTCGALLLLENLSIDLIRKHTPELGLIAFVGDDALG